MQELNEPSLRFTPSRVEGLPDVTEVVIYPRHLEVLSADHWRTFRFIDMVRWLGPKWLWKFVFRRGSQHFLFAVAGRFWCLPNEEQFFAFYTEPQFVVYMPIENSEEYPEGNFRKIKSVLRAGGFGTDDLG